MRRLATTIALALSMASAGCAPPQECRSSVPLPAEGWAPLPFSPSAVTDTQVFQRLVCTACSPAVEVVLAAAPPRVPMPASPSGRAWAEAPTTDHHERAVRQVLDNLRATSPGCTVTGHARPGANVGSLGVLPIDVQKICPGKREERQTNFLSYDGRCLYMTLALWYGPPLDEAVTQRLLRLVAGVRFGR